MSHLLAVVAFYVRQVLGLVATTARTILVRNRAPKIVFFEHLPRFANVRVPGVCNFLSPAPAAALAAVGGFCDLPK